MERERGTHGKSGLTFRQLLEHLQADRDRLEEELEGLRHESRRLCVQGEENGTSASPSMLGHPAVLANGAAKGLANGLTAAVHVHDDNHALTVEPRIDLSKPSFVNASLTDDILASPGSPANKHVRLQVPLDHHDNNGTCPKVLDIWEQTSTGGRSAVSTPAHSAHGHLHDDWLAPIEESAYTRSYAPEETSFVEHMTQQEHETLRYRACQLLKWWPFDVFVGLVVVMDCFSLGLSVEFGLHPRDGWLMPWIIQRVENVCAVIYLLELLLRFYAFGVWFCFANPLVRIDIFIVCCSALEIFLKAGRLLEGQWLGQLALLRTLRILRIARAARMSVHMRTLWLLISGLQHSASTILWTFILITGTSYTFAVLGMMLFPPPDLNRETKFNDVAVTYFGSLTDSMLTLLQVLTLDSIGSIYRPLILDGPHPWLAMIYFVLYILVVSVALMNLVTAVMVEGALKQAAEDNEFQQKMEDSRKEELLPKVREMFDAIDADGSGEVSLEELEEAPDELKQSLMKLVGTSDWSPIEIFHLIDEDGSGSLAVDELLNGLLRCSKESAVQKIQMGRLLRQVHQLAKTQHDVNEVYRSSVSGLSLVMQPDPAASTMTGFSRASSSV
eukprot:TRINITY_DN23217_c0_g1_i1.p1 TRINITY_DN23217_c0_g1~~TRINITY_DN23217_c0_g1_i1.p1  ORF type:complete len:615 (-),score=101.65 TRINITY_DN23217_c0_g1_i1:434-2278(-)